MTRITRVEVITNTGRDYVSWEDDNDIVTSIQDEGRTLKIFVNKVEPKTGEEGALEALDKFQNDWLLGKKCPETKLEIKNLNSVESIKAEIKLLQSKLEFYEELEKTKSPVEEAYKDWWGQYPETGNWDSNDDTRWAGFQAGYNAAYEEKVAEEPEKQQKWDVVRESVKWCKEHPDESVEDWVKPQTPEQVADGLKEAFREAVKQNIVSSVDKPKTLTDLIYRWWEDVFTTHSDWDMETSIEDLVDQIQLWLPKEQSSAGSQNAYVECSVEGFNDCLKKIKGKLR